VNQKNPTRILKLNKSITHSTKSEMYDCHMKLSPQQRTTTNLNKQTTV